MAGIGDPTHPDHRMHQGLPVKPRKRMIYSFHCSSDAQGLRHCPLVTNVTGDYFRPEGRGNLFLAGKSPAKVLKFTSAEFVKYLIISRIKIQMVLTLKLITHFLMKKFGQPLQIGFQHLNPSR